MANEDGDHRSQSRRTGSAHEPLIQQGKRVSVIAAIQRRIRDRQSGEGGFTLIELMVVVMIIAILLGIAIPAFLGAKSRAQDTASKSNLRNALGAAQTRFSDQQVFEAVGAIVTGLGTDEPSLTFKDGSVLGAGNSTAPK